MDMSDIYSELPDSSEVARSGADQEPSHHLSSPAERTPFSGDSATADEAAQGGSELREMEPSLEPYAELVELAPENGGSLLPPGDDIDFPPSHSSPEIPGASSVMISRWDMRGSPPQSPRSVHSSHSSFSYPSGSARTSIGGGPEPSRSLVRSREPKADLSTGDVVMLMHKGRPYVAVQARLPYKEDALHTVLELAQEGAAPESEALSYLEVVKQGNAVGFRSGAAGNRFIQPQRKAPHRLVFFNQNCGIWEHWTPLGDEWRAGPWSTLSMKFQSRRLANVCLTVDVVRVGYFSAPGFAGPPRSLLPVIPEDPLLEDRNLRRISNLLVAEWFKFVDHEKLLREGLEADLAALVDETQELKLKTIQQVEYLRVHMNEEIASMSRHVMLRDDALATMRRWLRRAQQLAADRMARQRHRRILMAWRYVVDDIVFRKTAILKLRRKRENAVREAAFRAWNLHTRAALGAAVKLKFAVQRRSHSLMSRVLRGWKLVVAHRAWCGRAMLAAVQRRSVRRLAAAFKSWRLLAVQRALGRRALLRALHGVNQSWMAAALMAWRAATQAMHQRVVQAELLVARRGARLQAAALDAWREQVFLGRQADRHARTWVMRRTLTAWRHAVSAVHTRQAAVEALAAARLGARRRGALVAWRAAAAAAAALRLRLQRHVMARAAAVQGRALVVWSLAARERRRRRQVLQRHLAAVRTRVAAAVLTGWKAVATRAVWRRVRVMAALGRASTRRLTAALALWHSYATARRAISGRAALAASRLRRMRLVACLVSWRHVASRYCAARANLLALCKRLLSFTLSGAFREWRLLSATASASRTAIARALPARTRELLSHVLATWWARHCAFGPGEEGGVLMPARSAAASVSTDAGAVSSPSGLNTGYAEAAAAAAAAAVAATEPLGYVTASPRQTLIHLYDTAIQTAASAPSRGVAVATYGSVGAPAESAAAPAEQLSAEPEGLAAATEETISPQHELSASEAALADTAASSAAAGVFASPTWLPQSLRSAEVTPTASPLSRGSLAAVASAPPTASRSLSQLPLPTAPLVPSPPSSAVPVQRSPRGSSSAGGAVIASAEATPRLPSELSTNFPNALAIATYTPPTQRRSRTYREALVAGAAAAMAAAAGRVTSGGAAAVAAGGQGRSSSTGRIRGSSGGLSGGASGAAGPFLPANAAVIGSGSSAVLLEMGPSRGGEGPLTPVGLPELLDGSMPLSREGSFAAGFGLAGARVAAAIAAAAEGEAVAAGEARPDMAPETSVELRAALQELQSAAALAARSEVGTPTASRAVGFAEEPAEEVGQQHRLQQQVCSAALTVSMSAPVMVAAAARPQPVSAGGRRAALAATVRSGLGRWLATAVLSHWRRAVVAQRRWIACLETVATAHRRQMSRDVLGAWWAAAAAAKVKVAAAAALAVKARARSGRQALREALALWHGVARRRAVVRALLARHLARVGVAMSRRVLTGWHGVAAGLAAAERKVERHVMRREQARVARVLRSWRDEAAARAARCAAARDLANNQVRGLLASALKGWSGAATARRERSARQARAARHAARRRLVGAFRGWRWAAEEASEREVAAARVSRATALRSAFGSWWRLTAAANQVGSVDIGASLQRATGWHERRLLRGCLCALAEHREQQQEVQRVAEAFWCRSTQAAVLAAWRLEAAWAAWGASEVARLNSRSAQRLQLRCLSGWMELAESSAAARAAAAQLAAQREKGLVADLLAGWQAAVCESAAARAREASCVRRIGRGCLQRALLSWSEAAADRRASRLRRQVVRRRLDMLRLRRVVTEWFALAADLRELRAEAGRRYAAASTALLSLAFAGWVDLTQRLRAARAAAATRGSVADLSLMRHALGCWSAAVERSRAAAAAADAMAARRAAALLPAALRAWAVACCEDEARRLQMAALRNLMARRRMAFTRRAFTAWREAVSEHQARDDELRRCIKRKKLAFSLFKQWYWEAFDSEVQATISRMFHTTDPAAHSPEPSSRAFPGTRHPQPALHQSLPAYMLQHQQYVNRRTAPGASWGGSSVARAGDLPPLDLDDPHEAVAAEWAVAAADYRPRPLLTAGTSTDRTAAHQPHPARTSQAATARSHLLAQSRLNTATAAPHHQHSHPPHPQTQPEAVRTLASTFDAVAQLTSGAVASGGRARAPPVATPLLSAAAGGRGAAAAAGRRDGGVVAGVTVPRSAAYPVLRPSDSDTSDEQDPVRGLGAPTAAARPAAAAAPLPARRRDTGAATTASGRAAAATRSAGGAGTSAPGRRVSAASGPAKSAGNGRTPPAAPATGTASSSRRSSTSSAASKRPSTIRATASASVPMTAATAMRANSNATAAAMAAAAAAAATPSLEAMSAALTVAIRSLDLAAGVVNSGAASGAAATAGIGGAMPAVAVSGRASRVTISSVGSAAGPSIFGAPRISVDGSTAGGNGSTAGGANGQPLSPLSPPPRAPYSTAYDIAPNSAGSGAAGSASAVLPGVVPTWRKVANNQLYSCDEEWYGDDLGPVDPLYVGIAGAGASIGVGGYSTDGRRRMTVEADESEGEAGAGSATSRMEAALSIRTMLLQQAAAAAAAAAAGAADSAGVVAGSVGGAISEAGGTGNASAFGSRRVSSDAGSSASYFPRHSIFLNAVFQPQARGADEEGSGLQHLAAALEEQEMDGGDEPGVGEGEGEAAADEEDVEYGLAALDSGPQAFAGSVYAVSREHAAQGQEEEEEGGEVDVGVVEVGEAEEEGVEA